MTPKSSRYLKHSVIALYALIQAFLLSLLFIWTLPTLPGTSWPVSLIPAYLLGTVASTIITFFIAKWRIAFKVKMLVLIFVIIIIAVISFGSATANMRATKMRAIKALGVSLQMLNGSPPQYLLQRI